MKWIGLYSQTGSELRTIADYIGQEPEVFTNSENMFSFKQFHNLKRGTHKEIMSWLMSQEEQCLVTLHGYLRILPPEVCEKHIIFNGHPAAIHLYPELKGKDKQIDAFTHKDKYPVIGSVVHRVTAELDAGEIVQYITVPNNVRSVEEAFRVLKTVSLFTWKEFVDENRDLWGTVNRQDNSA